jgi:hypothetical protein
MAMGSMWFFSNGTPKAKRIPTILISRPERPDDHIIHVQRAIAAGAGRTLEVVQREVIELPLALRLAEGRQAKRGHEQESNDRVLLSLGIKASG